jgi:tetratricopeptide (TPR) repeat protein
VQSVAITEEPQKPEPVELSPIVTEVISVEEVVELTVEPKPEIMSEVHVVELVAEVAEPAPVEPQPAPQEEFKLRKNILGGDDGLAALSALYSTGYDITRLESVPEKPEKKADIRTGQKSFNDWLQAFSGAESPADSPVTGNIHKEKQKELLEAFIKNEPRIRVTPASQPSVSHIDKQDDNQPLPASETLASLLDKQGHYDKAIKMYRDLILKYPEKNTYFANLIFTIEEKLKTDKSN